MTDTSQTRDYRMGKRLDEVARTRRRIVEAAVELHGSVGPANTTFSAVADLAGVQRSTLYRHFPDETALFGACTSHYMARNPWPAFESWRQQEEPLARLSTGLTDLYRYYASNRPMLSNSYRDIEVMPQFVGDMMREQRDSTVAVLAEPFEVKHEAIASAISLAVDFRTWTVLDEGGLEPDEAAELMVAMIRGLTP